MKRKEFLKKGLVLGLGSPLALNALASCQSELIEVPSIATTFTGKVIIVGAGAAGLSAGYLLERSGVDFEIIEAADRYGGRVKHTTDFVDFPVDLGAEWIHAEPSVLADIIDDPTVNTSLDFVTYNPQTFQIWKDGELRDRDFARHFYSEYKFKNSSWYGFFEQFIVPSIMDRIRLNEPVTSINYSQDKVIVTTRDGEEVEGEKVLVTVPIKILKEGDINFTPALPEEKTSAISSVTMDDGLKAFVEFSERFYPDLLGFDSILRAFLSDNQLYYDAAFRKDTDRHVLGLFTINEQASTYVNQGSDERILEYIISQLDEIFDGQASRYYLQHRIQNWSAEPYVRGSYSYNFTKGHSQTVEQLMQPVDNKLFFAGEALSLDYQAMVHGAAQSGYTAVDQILNS